MRAVWLQRFGRAEELVAGDAPDPVPGDGQALIEVAFASITFVETQFRATGAGPFKGELPLILGNGVGGVVHAVGPGAGADLVGRRVISATGGAGGYAELVAVDAGGMFEVPAGMALDVAAALLADGRTACMLVARAGIVAGERVLVEAAAGGVGTLLVQLARTGGATVVAAAGGERKLALARVLGADLTVDYREEGWTARVGHVDVVLDGVGGTIGRAAFELLAPGGRLLRFGVAGGGWTSVSDAEAAARHVTLMPAFGAPAEMRGFTERALAEAAAGRLRPVIGQRFPLDRAADAHAAIESRATIGKTLLEVTPLRE